MGSVKPMVLVSALLAAGCGSGSNSVLVRERFEPIQVPNRLTGRSAIECKLGATYTVREATGTAYLTQTKVVRLRLGVPRGTRTELDCVGPLVVELPATATSIAAHVGRRRLGLRRVPSLPLAAGGALRPRPRTQLVVVDWPQASPTRYDKYRIVLRFRARKAPFVRERVVYTARVACGETSSVQPVVPMGDGLGWINAYTMRTDGKAFDFIVPRLASGIRSLAVQTRVLRCRP
jgi:hypothetical protein